MKLQNTFYALSTFLALNIALTAAVSVPEPQDIPLVNQVDVLIGKFNLSHKRFEYQFPPYLKPVLCFLAQFAVIRRNFAAQEMS